MTSVPAARHQDDRPAPRPTRRPGPSPRPGRRRVPAVRTAALAAGAVLLLGAGLTACKGGVSVCLDDISCTVTVRTDSSEAANTIEVFGSGKTLWLTVGRITDTTAEVRLGDETRTLTEDKATVIGAVTVTLRHANAREHSAELQVVR
ncbi:hypothetical protein ABT093_22375 [Kitasatospora sp. NPDC002551]|uniref:hypothetical protein n=1 Tax=Kitasatospora sp. NPDC002551 TaxID=3154539 RepID=UPI00331EFF41